MVDKLVDPQMVDPPKMPRVIEPNTLHEADLRIFPLVQSCGMWPERFTEALGKTFDPSLHEAAFRRPGATTDEVLEELRWGRPVVVGFGRCGIFPRDFPF